jgi:hypothetical protein
MKPDRIVYRRLPGRSSRFMHSATCWLGPDHLLVVQTDGFTETYKRFYFADVKAFFIRRTVLWAVNLSVSALLALGCALTIFVLNEEVWRVTWAVLTGCCLAFFLVHLAWGPTCACYVQTPVQTEALSPLRRVRSARKTIARLKPLILQAQAGAAQPNPAAS